MANFLRTVLDQNSARSSDATVQFQLPVNPITMILVTLRCVATTAATNTPISDILGLVDSLGVIFRGQDIVRGNLADLAMVNAIVCGAAPWGVRPSQTDANTFSITVPICLGRRPFLVKECFPAVRRGDLLLELAFDTVQSNADLIESQIETVELLDETPERYLKYTTAQVTFASTGEQDVRLPIGNPLLGVLLQGATVPSSTNNDATWERLRLRVDNVEALYARANWASLNGEMGRKLMYPTEFLNDHRHGGTYTTTVFGSSNVQGRPGGIVEQYAFLDFDPLMDSSFMLETAGRADVVIHRDNGTADVGRFLPVELVEVRGQTPGAAAA
jgi:hypothetical protein